MKKSILGIFVLGICVLAMSSCSKERTCTCTTVDSATNATSSVSTTITGNKSASETACNISAGSVGTVTTTCELK